MVQAVRCCGVVWMVRWKLFHIGVHMKVIQITIDEPLLTELDRVAACEGKSRSLLVRDTLARMLRKRKFADWEREEIEALRKHPQDLSEVEEWLEVQDWGDE
jgi:hypothetical protein